MINTRFRLFSLMASMFAALNQRHSNDEYYQPSLGRGKFRSRKYSKNKETHSYYLKRRAKRRNQRNSRKINRP